LDKYYVTNSATTLAFLAFATFACGDAIVKAIGTALNPFEVAFFGYVIPLMLSSVFMAPGDSMLDLVRWNRPWLMSIRSLCVASTSPLIIIAFTGLPFAEAFALLFLVPSLVAILAVLVLKEPVKKRHGLAIGLAFFGVLVTLRPGFKEILPGHLAAIGGALCSAAVMITGRMIGQTEKRFTLTGTVFLATATISGLMMIPNFIWPTLHQWILLTSFAATALIGGRLLVLATMYAPAEQVGAAQYSQVVWALVLGALFFNEWPDTIGLFGTLVITGSGLLMYSTGLKLNATGSRMSSLASTIHALKKGRASEDLLVAQRHRDGDCRCGRKD
jgi:S-adenosylmethionine uptake transporter